MGKFSGFGSALAQHGIKALAKQKKDQADALKRDSDVRFAAADLATTKVPDRSELQRPAEGLPEFNRLKDLAKQRIAGQFGAAEREQDISRKRAFSKLGGAAGIQQQVAGEQKSQLAKARSGAETEAINQLDVAESQELERRFEFDAGMAFQKTAMGQQLLQGWEGLDLQEKEDVGNFLIALETAGISAADVNAVRPIISTIFGADLPATHRPGGGGRTVFDATGSGGITS